MNLTHKLAVGGLALAASGMASAQVTFYGQENFRGRAITVESSLPNLQGSRLDDRASSVSVRNGTWQLCSEPFYRGACVTLGPGDYPSLRAAGLNNAVSSAREIGWMGDRPGERPRGPDQPRVVLYEGPNFTGRSVNVDGFAESLDRFNDRARSMIIYDGEWELCEHDRFRGDCIVFRTGRHANLGKLSGDLSSLRPLGDAPGGGGPRWGDGARVMLYEGTNFRGRSLMVDETLLADLRGSGFNDRVSSLRVESGYWIFCSEANFHGQCRTFGPGDYAQLPPGLDDRVSSGRRIHEAYPYAGEPRWGAGPR